jgi:hypothetical protein
MAKYVIVPYIRVEPEDNEQFDNEGDAQDEINSLEAMETDPPQTIYQIEKVEE